MATLFDADEGRASSTSAIWARPLADNRHGLEQGPGNQWHWARPREDGSLAVGLFNRSEMEATVTVNWSDLGIQGKQRARDLWRQKDLGTLEGRFSALVPAQGVVLIRLWPGEK